MTGEPPQGSAIRAVGLPPPIDKTKRKTTGRRRRGDSGDRWALSNAIDDRLGWMPHPEYRVLRVLFRHADPTGKAWPGQSGIGRSCGLDRGHVSRLLGRLVRWGVVEVVRRGHKGSRKAAEYRIRPPSEWPTEEPPD